MDPWTLVWMAVISFVIWKVIPPRVKGAIILCAVLMLVAGLYSYALAQDYGTGTGVRGHPKTTELAKREIPPRYRAAYQQAAKQCPGLHWTVVAAVGSKESDHGRVQGGGVHRGRNPGAGERGPAQFTDGAWQQHGRGNPYKPEDAFAATARKLCHDGAPGNTRKALYHYNGAWSYADSALGIADAYRKGHF